MRKGVRPKKLGIRWVHFAEMDRGAQVTGHVKRKGDAGIHRENTVEHHSPGPKRANGQGKDKAIYGAFIRQGNERGGPTSCKGND